MAAVAGFDFVLVDCEHGPADVVALRQHIAVAAVHGVPVVVRVGEDDAGMILRALDQGARRHPGAARRLGRRCPRARLGSALSADRHPRLRHVQPGRAVRADGCRGPPRLVPREHPRARHDRVARRRRRRAGDRRHTGPRRDHDRPGRPGRGIRSRRSAVAEATARVNEAIAAGGQAPHGHRGHGGCRGCGVRRRRSARRLQPGVLTHGASEGAAGSARLTQTRGEDHRGAVLASMSQAPCVAPRPHERADGVRSLERQQVPAVDRDDPRSRPVPRRSPRGTEAGRSRPARPTRGASGRSRRAGPGGGRRGWTASAAARAVPPCRSHPPSPAFAPRGRGGPSPRQARAVPARMSACRLRGALPGVEPVDPRPPRRLLLGGRRLRVRRHEAQPLDALRSASDERHRDDRAERQPAEDEPRRQLGEQSIDLGIDRLLVQHGCERVIQPAARPEVGRAVHPGQQDERQHVSP